MNNINKNDFIYEEQNKRGEILLFCIFGLIYTNDFLYFSKTHQFTYN